MSFENTVIRGVKILMPPVFNDNRGSFFKTFHEEQLAAQEIQFILREEFFSISRKNVLRGMHFQVPPAAHAKIVTCLTGRILDVLLDLRQGQAGYGRTFSIELSGENKKVLYIPEGIAHGFLSLEEDSLVHYKTSTVHSPTCDRGVHWRSFGFNWPLENPIVSERDQNHPSFLEFDSPF